MKLPIVVAAGLALYGVALAQEGPALTPITMQTALAAKPEGAEAERLAERIRAYFGGSEALVKGAPAKIDELTVAWALEAPQLAANAPVPRVAWDPGNYNLPLTKVGTSGLYAGTATLAHGTAFNWHYEAGDRRFGGGQVEAYETHPDSREQPGVPKGTVKQMPSWESKIFSGTRRDWWVYVPAQYKPETPAAVMVFQDGAGPKDYVPTVFDNLIAKGDMPVTVGIFIQPGVFAADGRANRSFEYDTLSDQYARFLLEEILPEVEKTVKLRHDAASRAISGASSGGICAFTVAWERPDQFSKVLSWIGSFTNIAARQDGPRRRTQLRSDGPEDDAEKADPGLSPGRRERPGQRERQLAAREPDARQVAGLCAVRLQVRVRAGLPQQPARPCDPAGFAALAVARV